MPIAEEIAAAKGALEVSKLTLDLLRRPEIDGFVGSFERRVRGLVS
jgi:hypothetical protein